MINMDFERVMKGAFHPVRAKPLKDVLSGTIGTTTALATPTLGVGSASVTVRRVRIVNTHATQSLALILDTSDALALTGTITDGYRVLAGASFEILVEAGMSIAVVGSGAATTFDFKVSDFT